MLETIVSFLESLKEYGYKSYYVEPEYPTGRGYAYTVTPNRNILYLGERFGEGIGISFLYPPQKRNGSSCSCSARGVELSLETIQEAEIAGYAFACNLGATLYKSPDEWYSTHWNKENLIEI